MGIDNSSHGPDFLSESAVVLRTGLALSGVDLEELWVSYMGVGGTMSVAELTATLRGARDVTPHEHDLIAQALNDEFTERGQNHPVAYAEDLATSRRPRVPGDAERSTD